MKAGSKRLAKLTVEYLASLSDILYDQPTQHYYRNVLAKLIVHKASHLVHTRVKAEESQEILTYLPYASRDIIEIITRLPADYFFFPIGSRSLPRLLLKHFGLPPAIYLQVKSGFDITNYILKDPGFMSHMANFISKCWISQYINIDKLTPLDVHSMYNICLFIN